MTHILNFDKQSAAVTRNREFNIAFIHKVGLYINEVLECKGYVYLTLYMKTLDSSGTRCGRTLYTYTIKKILDGLCST